MVSIVSNSTTHKQICYKTTYRNGGFIVYWKLYLRLIPQYHRSLKGASIIHKAVAWSLFMFKTGWWLLIKPLGCIYKRKRIMEGSVYIMDGRIIESRTAIKKHYIHYMFSIPIMCHYWYLSQEDMDEILTSY